MSSKNNYKTIEDELQAINRSSIALPDGEVKRNNRVLKDVLDQIVPNLKQNDLFKFLYRDIFYSGSFFCGLKVGNPDEYDLIFLMKLPEYVKPTVSLGNFPGFLQIQLEGMKQWEEKHENYSLTAKSNATKTVQSATAGPKRKFKKKQQKIRGCSQKMQKLWDNIRYNTNIPLTEEQRIILSDLVSLLDDNYYLDATKVSAWIEGLITKAYNNIQKHGYIETSEGALKAKLHKGGPAFTLKLREMVSCKRIMVDIDLVPGFVFSNEQWPSHPFRKNPVAEKSEFFIVPKKPDKLGGFVKYYSFQPSFQAQETVLINDLQNLKPCIRLMKRLRDFGHHKSISSYHLKTIFLWELERDRNLWNEPLSYVFITMLKKCQEMFEKGEILSYWNKEVNLIETVSRSTLDIISNSFKSTLNNIERHPKRINRYLNGRNKKNRQ